MFKWAPRKKGNLNHVVSSPNQKINCRVFLKGGRLFYSIDFEDNTVVYPSALGFEICGNKKTRQSIKYFRERTTSHKETIEMLWGEDHFICNNYNEIAIELSKDQSFNHSFLVVFRVFDDAVAFRYVILPYDNTKRISIKTELTEFNVDQASTIWKIPALEDNRYEYDYEKTQLVSLHQLVHTPLTIKTPQKTYLSIHEAALYNYGAMNLSNKNGILAADITPLQDRTKAHVNLPFQTPWRLIMISKNAIGLTTNRVMYALNAAPKLDFSWVKTLKFIGIWWAMYVGEWTWAPGEKHGATTKHAKEYIDSAVRLGISGVLIEGWNDGWEGDWLEQGPNNSFTASTPDFDLGTVARYARSRHIELVGHHETVGFVDNYEQQIEAAYNLYATNGIHYLKTGYSNTRMYIHGRSEFHHSQLGVNHYQKTIELAAKKHICLNIHEPIKGTGIERTWPNLLTREGARGQEYESGVIKPSHVCTLPYTRLLAGGMDYTSGIFDLNNKNRPIFTTLARQLAYYVVIYSGMQMAADRPSVYEGELSKAFLFIKNVPTNFEKSIPLAGEIGEFYVVARKDRDSETWLIGGVTNEIPRDLDLKLDFLDEKPYLAEIYEDKITSDYKKHSTDINIYEKNVNNKSTIKIHMSPVGGFAIRIRPL